MRKVIKFIGQSGQGLDTIGQIIIKALNSMGYYTIGYREYPSLIKGGNATFQIDISTKPIYSPLKFSDINVVINRQYINYYLETLVDAGMLIISNPHPKLSIDINEELTSRKIQFHNFINNSIDYDLQNTFLLTKLWEILKFPKIALIDAYKSVLDHDKLKPNLELLDQIPENIFNEIRGKSLFDRLFLQDVEMRSIKSIYGAEAICDGVMNAKVESFFGYPMTPASPILTILSKRNVGGKMIVKQVEDEISAIGMVTGASFMGKRSLTATSGGGFDLMTEHISLSAIGNLPLVIILAQRPGPATGMPTWTQQGDLLTAIFSGHGEFSKVVMSINSIQDAKTDIARAYEISEKWKIPVIILTDKFIGESFFTDFEVSVNTNTTNLVPLKFLNSDESNQVGDTTEDSTIASLNSQNRIQKLKDISVCNDLPLTLKNYDGKAVPQLTFITWGSSELVMMDVLSQLKEQKINAACLSIKMLWPLPSGLITNFIETYPKSILVENNGIGQLGKIIKMETGLDIKHKILKADGRPIFVEDVLTFLKQK